MDAYLKKKKRFNIKNGIQNLTKQSSYIIANV